MTSDDIFYLIRSPKNAGASSGGGALLKHELTLSELLCSLYDCAVAPDLWSTLLPMLATYMESHTAAMAARRHRDREPYLLVEYGVDPKVHELYVSTYRAINPRLAAFALCSVDEPVRTEDIMDITEYRQSAFYREFCIGYGIGEILGAKIIEDERQIVSCNVTRPAPYTDDDVNKLRELCPHIRRVLKIADLLERSTLERNSFAQILDHLSVPIVIINPLQQIMHANLSAKELLVKSSTRNSLHHVLSMSGAHKGQLDDPTAIVEIASFPVELSNGKTLAVTVLPLTSGRRKSLAEALSASAVVFLQTDPVLDESDASPPASAVFGLTGAESRVLASLLAGLSPSEIAIQNRVSINTIRTHLRRLFVKTGTGRQSDLVRVASRATLPIRRTVKASNDVGSSTV